MKNYKTRGIRPPRRRSRKVIKGEHDASTRIKVQLDNKTMMIIHSMTAFRLWKKRYPLARVIA